jgi:hypothetical protein
MPLMGTASRDNGNSAHVPLILYQDMPDMIELLN